MSPANTASSVILTVFPFQTSNQLRKIQTTPVNLVKLSLSFNHLNNSAPTLLFGATYISIHNICCVIWLPPPPSKLHLTSWKIFWKSTWSHSFLMLQRSMYLIRKISLCKTESLSNILLFRLSWANVLILFPFFCFCLQPFQNVQPLFSGKDCIFLLAAVQADGQLWVFPD